MSDSSTYQPPRVWTWNKPSGGRFANISRPLPSATHEKDLPLGRHPLLSKGQPPSIEQPGNTGCGDRLRPQFWAGAKAA